MVRRTTWGGSGVGARATAEIGEAAVCRFVAEFMAERPSGGGGVGRNAADGVCGEEGSDEEVDGRRARAHREEAQKKLKTLLKGVELAAGGDVPFSYAFLSSKVVHKSFLHRNVQQLTRSAGIKY